ncbi:MAG: PD40 domain-containing protein [Salinivirgaceae bacterium]|nr:PD40 domain-containing protein [Salinivirgaceae bacterium]
MISKLNKKWLAILFVSALLSSAQAQEDARLLRYPDINGELVSFVYAGDIWTVSSNGGEAKRLTSHMGMELFPKISPDGNWIAFSAEYSGSRQIYVMPSKGGEPRQLTWYNDVGAMPPRGGFDNCVLDWTPDSKNIMIRSNRTPFGERMGKYFMVSIDGGLEKPMQITEAGFGVLAPDAKKVCFAPVSREFRTWKRYKGGRAADLWIYDLENNLSERITTFPGTDQIPTWYKNNIYFASDRDLHLNIYSYDISTKEIKQITNHAEYDVMWPSGENGQIAYENGGFLYKLNLETEVSEKISVNIHFDNPNVIPYFKNVSDQIHSWSISPNGKRALFDARGDIFSVPAENGITYNLTQTQGVREIYPNWSPDGKWITYHSDASGEYEVYLLENKKGAKPRQLTNDSNSWKYNAVWSPDNKYMLYSDRELKLKLLELATAKHIEITQGLDGEIRTYSFSPDSKWVTYSKAAENGQNAIWVYNLESKQNHKITDDTFNDGGPVFSQKGDYIYFVSNRDFNLNFSSFEFNYIYDKATKIYALSLKADAPKLFEDKNDMVSVEEEKAADKTKKDKEKKEEKASTSNEIIVSIDFEGIESRITALPLESGSYFSLSATEKGLMYISDGNLYEFNIEDKKTSQIISGISAYELSAKGNKVLYNAGDSYGIISLSADQNSGAGKLNLDAVEMKIDPRKEWNQIYTDGWRIFRDYFYVPNMHGVDWKGIKERYGALVPYVSHRADLDYILGEIISETNTGHSYVNYGDFEPVKRIETGLLGAQLVADSSAGRYKIQKIYDSENWNKERQNPLTEQGVHVNEGDYLLSINGKELKTDVNPYVYLENTVDKLTEIVVNAKPVFEGARSYQIRPIASEGNLRYITWVNERRAMVDKLSNGRIGYIHVPNTSFEGNYELHRGMYAYHNKEALIIDDRYNGGGFIPDVMADLLDRKTLSYWHQNGLRPFKTPGIAHDGPKIMLINHYSSSGGDCFPYYFRKKGLGKLIGTRTWGGLVGMSGNASLVDGGYIAVPRFGIFDENEEWIIEGVGVYPDIEVYDEPHKVATGSDPSVERAVQELLKKLETEKHVVPKDPPSPDRSKWNEMEIK